MSETLEIDGYTVTIEQDTDAQNPLTEWESPGTLATWHRRYDLGTVQPSESPEDYLAGLVPYSVTGSFEERETRLTNREYDNRYSVNSWDQSFRFDYDSIRETLESRKQKAIQKWIDDNLVLINVYLYDHSGLALSSSPFSCSWDSGQVGIYFLTPEEVESEFSGDEERALAYLESSLKTYGQYVSGEVYGVSEITDPEGNEIEEGSCWGYYGSNHEESGLLEFARDSINHHKRYLERESRESFDAACRDIVTV